MSAAWVLSFEVEMDGVALPMLRDTQDTMKAPWGGSVVHHLAGEPIIVRNENEYLSEVYHLGLLLHFCLTGGTESVPWKPSLTVSPACAVWAL